eukprot:Amastigsp_a181275_21.p4 type:complete len:161 gc:universal Amastigsp_a181275_21:1738-1256(-)
MRFSKATPKITRPLTSPSRPTLPSIRAQSRHVGSEAFTPLRRPQPPAPEAFAMSTSSTRARAQAATTTHRALSSINTTRGATPKLARTSPDTRLGSLTTGETRRMRSTFRARTWRRSDTPCGARSWAEATRRALFSFRTASTRAQTTKRMMFSSFLGILL